MNSKFLDLKNKNIIITGGNGFFGKQMSNAFCNQGSNVFVLDMKNSQPKSWLQEDFKTFQTGPHSDESASHPCLHGRDLLK